MASDWPETEIQSVQLRSNSLHSALFLLLAELFPLQRGSVNDTQILAQVLGQMVPL